MQKWEQNPTYQRKNAVGLMEHHHHIKRAARQQNNLEAGKVNEQLIFIIKQGEGQLTTLLHKFNP